MFLLFFLCFSSDLFLLYIHLFTKRPFGDYFYIVLGFLSKTKCFCFCVFFFLGFFRVLLKGIFLRFSRVGQSFSGVFFCSPYSKAS